MSFGTDNPHRAARRILAAMIVCGATLTGLSFAMQLDQSAFKSQLEVLMSGLTSSTETPSR